MDKIRNLLEELRSGKGTESVSVNGTEFVDIQHLKLHPPQNPQIRVENGDLVDFHNFSVFLNKDNSKKFITDPRHPETSSNTRDVIGFPIEKEKRTLIIKTIHSPIPEPWPDPQRTEKIKILFVAANPNDQRTMDTDVEHRLLKANIERGREGRNGFEFLPSQFATTRSELLRAISDGPNIVHFAGHGVKEGLLVTTEDNRTQLLSTEALQLLFKGLCGTTRLVVMNACYSAEQAQVLSAMGMYVIGHNMPIGDPAAISFTEGFYIGLGEGKSIENAFNDGLFMVSSTNQRETGIIEIWKDGKKLEL